MPDLSACAMCASLASLRERIQQLPRGYWNTVRDCSIMVEFTQILHWKIFKRKATINNHVYIMNYRNVARFIVICTSLLHCSSPSPMLRGAHLHPCFSQCKHGQWLYVGAQHSQYKHFVILCSYASKVT